MSDQSNIKYCLRPPCNTGRTKNVFHEGFLHFLCSDRGVLKTLSNVFVLLVILVFYVDLDVAILAGFQFCYFPVK